MHSVHAGNQTKVTFYTKIQMTVKNTVIKKSLSSIMLLNALYFLMAVLRV